MRVGSPALLKFSRVYFALAVLLFIVEVMIALFLPGGFVRAYVGDVLVVMLMYCAVRSLFDIPVVSVVAGVLVFAFVVEALQYVSIVERLGLESSAIARTVIGTSFSWIDVLAYMIGGGVILAVDYRVPLKKD